MVDGLRWTPMSRRSSQNQLTWREEVVAAVLWGCAERYPAAPVWGRDVERWLDAHPGGPHIAYPTIDNILSRFENRRWVSSGFEQLIKPEGRPQRKFYALTRLGRDGAVTAIQSLRAGSRRPSWLPIPELNPGLRDFVVQPEGFSLTEPAGRIVGLDSRPLRAVSLHPG